MYIGKPILVLYVTKCCQESQAHYPESSGGKLSEVSAVSDILRKTCLEADAVAWIVLEQAVSSQTTCPRGTIRARSLGAMVQSQWQSTTVPSLDWSTGPRKRWDYMRYTSREV